MALLHSSAAKRAKKFLSNGNFVQQIQIQSYIISAAEEKASETEQQTNGFAN